MEIFQKAITSFLPTPSKSHYLFNLRDFARVIQVCHLMFKKLPCVDNNVHKYSNVHSNCTQYNQTTLTNIPLPQRFQKDLINLIIFQGILLIRPESVPEGTAGNHKLTRLWVHEVYRVFYDRLVDDADRDQFFTLCQAVVSSQFKVQSYHLFFSSTDHS